MAIKPNACNCIAAFSLEGFLSAGLVLRAAWGTRTVSKQSLFHFSMCRLFRAVCHSDIRIQGKENKFNGRYAWKDAMFVEVTVSEAHFDHICLCGGVIVLSLCTIIKMLLFLDFLTWWFLSEQMTLDIYCNAEHVEFFMISCKHESVHPLDSVFEIIIYRPTKQVCKDERLCSWIFFYFCYF